MICEPPSITIAEWEAARQDRADRLSALLQKDNDDATAERQARREAMRERKRQERLRRIREMRERQMKPVTLLDGNRVIERFPSAEAAACALGLSSSAIRECIRRRGHLHDGRRVTYEPPLPAERRQAVRIRRSDGRVFESIAAALDFLGDSSDRAEWHREYWKLHKSIRRRLPYRGMKYKRIVVKA